MMMPEDLWRSAVQTMAETIVDERSAMICDAMATPALCGMCKYRLYPRMMARAEHKTRAIEDAAAMPVTVRPQYGTLKIRSVAKVAEQVRHARGESIATEKTQTRKTCLVRTL